MIPRAFGELARRLVRLLPRGPFDRSGARGAEPGAADEPIPFPFPPPPAFRLGGAGLLHAAIPGEGLEFRELKVYEPGDPVRLVDWRATARRGRLHVRRHDADRSGSVALVLDASSSMAHAFRRVSKARMAAEILLAVGRAAARAGHARRFVRFAATVELDRRVAGRLVPDAAPRRELLAPVRPRAVADWTELADRLAHRSRRGALTILATDALDDPARLLPAWEALRSRGSLWIVRVRTPAECEPGLEPVGLVAARDRETGADRLVFLPAPPRPNRAPDPVAAWTARRRVPILDLRVDQPPWDALRDFLAARSREPGPGFPLGTAAAFRRLPRGGRIP